MDKKDYNKYVSSGIFFVAGIALFLFLVFFIGKDKGFGQGKFQVQVLFRNIGGLTEGAPIRLAGVNVGTVGSINFLENEVEDRRVIVDLNIYKKFRHQILKSTRFVIKTEGILGGKIIEISVEPDNPPLDLSKPVIGEDPLDVQDLAEVFVGAAESFTKTSQDLNNIDIEGLTNVLSETAESLLITSKNINSIVVELQVITKKSKRLLDRVEQRVIDGDLFKVF